MDALVAWLQATSLSKAIVFSLWVWPLAETLHFIGLTLLIGIVGFFDLRLMGFFRRVSLEGAHDLVPVAIAGFGLNLLTGIIFFVGHPEQYVHNVGWWWKVGCLVVAGANAGVFEMTIGKQTMALGPNADTSMAAKAIGLLSIVAWFGVLYFGRMLPFIGDAY